MERDMCAEFLEMCEDLETQADRLEETADFNAHQIGFARGQR